MDKNMRQGVLQTMVKQIAWALPGTDPDTCYDYLTYRDAKIEMRLKKYKNKGCKCFTGLIIYVDVFQPLKEGETKQQVDKSFALGVLEAKMFNGYKGWMRWYDATVKRLADELYEKTENERLDRVRALMAPVLKEAA